MSHAEHYVASWFALSCSQSRSRQHRQKNLSSNPNAATPDFKLIYWGVGNPGPDWNGDLRPGDNLYTCSLLALDVDTGKLRWYFQFTPNESHDWDAAHVPILFDTKI